MSCVTRPASGWKQTERIRIGGRENETKSISKISLEQKINELEKLADLKEKGIISDSEFEAEKQKLMQ